MRLHLRCSMCTALLHAAPVAVINRVGLYSTCRSYGADGLEFRRCLSMPGQSGMYAPLVHIACLRCGGHLSVIKIAGRFRVTLHEAALPATFLRRFPPDGWTVAYDMISRGGFGRPPGRCATIKQIRGRYWQHVRAIHRYPAVSK